ncbi:MAG: alpha/beta hydrolase [Actinobacteria bacterium]|nr:alpha/beta hydrolase [Actinomycetota bacterium]
MPSFTTADGRKLVYREDGRGPVLVCHPGGPGFSSRYFVDLAGLSAHRTLVLLDPRGTGGSSPPPNGSYEIADYAADLDELRQHLGLERIDLLGHSHGGVIAQAYAAANPDRVGKLVLASTLARFQIEQHEAMEKGMATKAHEPWFADAQAALEAEQAGQFGSDDELLALCLREMPFYFATYGAAEQEFVTYMGKDVICGAALKAFNDDIFTTFDLRSVLPQITAPTLVIAGTEDFITGPLCARELGELVPGARLRLLDGVGHMIFVEARDDVRAVILEFLDEPA